MRNRRFLICFVVAAATLAFTGSALAAAHPRHISGRVVSINVRRHTLRLRVLHARKGHAATAAAAGGSVVDVAFGHATVTGPDGAVAVGDEVTVTTGAGAGPTNVATSITVIGQPNGGDAGKGAAVPGVVSLVDALHGQLTLAVTSTDSQGQAQSSAVIVTVSPTTVLAVGDTNGDGAITLADVQVGDQVIVFTNNAAADPLATIGILDASHGGSNHEAGGDGGAGPDHVAIPGSVFSVDTVGMSLMITAGGDGPFAGQQITVKVTPDTSYGGTDEGGDASFGLADIHTGDQVTVYLPQAPAGGNGVALGIVDESASQATTTSSTDGSDSQGATGSDSQAATGSDNQGATGSASQD